MDSISLFLCFASCPSLHDHYSNHPWASTAWWLHQESLAFCSLKPLQDLLWEATQCTCPQVSQGTSAMGNGARRSMLLLQGGGEHRPASWKAQRSELGGRHLHQLLLLLLALCPSPTDSEIAPSSHPPSPGPHHRVCVLGEGLQAETVTFVPCPTALSS